MKKKLFTAIGLMSGTSIDGVDLSLIKSDGNNEFVSILDNYCEYEGKFCLLYTSPSPRDAHESRMPSSA